MSFRLLSHKHPPASAKSCNDTLYYSVHQAPWGSCTTTPHLQPGEQPTAITPCNKADPIIWSAEINAAQRGSIGRLRNMGSQRLDPRVEPHSNIYRSKSNTWIRPAVSPATARSLSVSTSQQKIEKSPLNTASSSPLSRSHSRRVASL